MARRSSSPPPRTWSALGSSGRSAASTTSGFGSGAGRSDIQAESTPQPLANYGSDTRNVDSDRARAGSFDSSDIGALSRTGLLDLFTDIGASSVSQIHEPQSIGARKRHTSFGKDLYSDISGGVVNRVDDISPTGDLTEVFGSSSQQSTEINSLSESSDQTSYISTNHTTIGQMMVTSDIVMHLGHHGCQDVTSLLDISTSSSWPVSSGGFGDVYKVKLLDSTAVAVKTTRVHINSATEGKKHLKHAARELHAWSKCNHPNILKLIGLAIFRGQIGMVSLWMENGDLPAYLSCHPEANRFHISMQIAEGLAYLHVNGIVHGDLKGMNVLVSSDGTPVLTDFGNAVLSNQSLLFTATTSQSSVSLRWTAPELLESDQSSPHSKEADVYALGMTILETITGEVPYSDKSEKAVMFSLLQKKLPNRPEALSTKHNYGDILWSLLTSCWESDTAQRPSAAAVMERMQTWVLLPSPGVDIPEPQPNSIVEERHLVYEQVNVTASSPTNETPKWQYLPRSGNIFSLGAPIQASRQATLPPGPKRIDPQESLGLIVAGSSQAMISKYMFSWSWKDPRSDISIPVGFSINSDVPVPSFKSAGAPEIKSLHVKYDRSRGQPHGFCSFHGIIGDERIYIEIPDWLIEIRGAIEGGSDAGQTFTGYGSWLSG